MTIHLHTKHYEESGLRFLDYMMLIMYEYSENLTVKDFEKMFNLSERTVIRMRGILASQGYLKKLKAGRFAPVTS